MAVTFRCLASVSPKGKAAPHPFSFISLFCSLKRLVLEPGDGSMGKLPQHKQKDLSLDPRIHIKLDTGDGEMDGQIKVLAPKSDLSFVSRKKERINPCKMSSDFPFTIHGMHAHTCTHRINK